MANDYDVEVTEAMVSKGRRAIELAKQAAQLWAEFEQETTGEVGTGNAGDSLEEAVDDMAIDLVRFS